MPNEEKTTTDTKETTANKVPAETRASAVVSLDEAQMVLPANAPLSLRIMFSDGMYNRVKQVAQVMSNNEGFTPPHLIRKTEACFSIVCMSLNWKLDPWMVAKSTFQTPGGGIGFEGKLVQAILEASGRLEGGVSYEFYGKWEQVHGKFEIKKSTKGKDYAAATWTPADAKGLGVTVIAQVKGEKKPRKWNFDLAQAFPLNSTLWATDPKTQICYTAVRRFGNVAAPGLMMGVPFTREEAMIDPAEAAVDITPRAADRPTRGDGQAAGPVQDVEESETGQVFTFKDAFGDEQSEHMAPDEYEGAVLEAMENADEPDEMIALYEFNESDMNDARDEEEPPSGARLKIDDLYKAAQESATGADAETQQQDAPDPDAKAEQPKTATKQADMLEGNGDQAAAAKPVVSDDIAGHPFWGSVSDEIAAAESVEDITRIMDTQEKQGNFKHAPELVARALKKFALTRQADLM